MSRDVTGALRADMFSVLKDAQGTSYQPISGRGNAITYQAQPDGQTVTTHTHRMHSGDALTAVLAPSSDGYPSLYGHPAASQPAPTARRAHEHSTNTHPAQRALK